MVAIDIFLDGGNYEEIFFPKNMIMLVACANLENERLRDDGERCSHVVRSTNTCRMNLAYL